MVEKGFDSFKGFFKGFSSLVLDRKFLFVLFLLLPLLFSIWFRAYPYYLPVADDFARSTINNNLKAQLSSQIDQQYPLLPADEKNRLLSEQLNKIITNDRDNYESQVSLLASQFRDRMRDEAGQTYLIAIDPYQHLRRTSNFIVSGHTGDREVDGEFFNDHQLAPMLRNSNPDFQIWAGFILYKVVSLFKPVELMSTNFWLPVIFVALAVIVAFLIGYRIAGLFGALLFSLMIGLSPSFIGRTVAGFADTDAYVILFPLLIAYFLLLAFDTDSWKKTLSYSLLAGFSATLYSFAWKAWFHIFLFVVFSLALALFYAIRRVYSKGFGSHHLNRSHHKRQGKDASDKGVLLWFNTFFNNKEWLLFSSFFGAYLISSLIFFSTAKTFSFITNTLSKIFAFDVAVKQGTIWPNVLTTVAELNSTNISGVISSITASSGVLGHFLFFASLLGLVLSFMPRSRWRAKDYYFFSPVIILYAFLSSEKAFSLSPWAYIFFLALPILIGHLLYWFDDRELSFNYSILLAIWFLSSFYSVTQGIRFTILLLPPFALSLLFTFSRALDFFSSWLADSLSLKRSLTFFFLGVVLLSFFSPMVIKAREAGYGQIPSMNDAWWNSLKKIDNEASPDAIVNSWWDFGHWFKYVADRGVTFDGASQNTPNAHWIGRVLLTSDEDEALAILRMVDCGNYVGFEIINKVLNDSLVSVKLLEKLLTLDVSDAKKLLLNKGFSEEDADLVLQLTHCAPPEDYFITSEDMVGKAGVWAHFGGWNFSKADFVSHYKDTTLTSDLLSAIANRYGWSNDEASALYYDLQSLPDQRAINSWISPWPSYAGGWHSCSPSDKGGYTCPVGMVVSRKGSSQTVLEAVVINDSLVNDSLSEGAVKLLIAGYVNGAKVTQSSAVAPSRFVMATNDSLIDLPVGKGGVSLGVLFDSLKKRVLLADPVLLTSTFTKLFYLDGRYSPGFEKFSDERSFRGEHIIVWKVRWPDSFNSSPYSFKHFFWDKKNKSVTLVD